MSRVNTCYNKVLPEINRLLLLNWRPLLKPQFGYENQLAVDMNQVDMTTSLALRSGLDPGKLVRTLGSEHTGAWRNVDAIFHEIESVVNLEDYQHVKRILTKGCPSKLMFDEPRKNKLELTKRGNQKSVLDNPELVNKITNKEDLYSHRIPLHNWVCKLGPHLRHNSQGIVDLKRLILVG